MGDVEERKMKMTLVIIFLPWERIMRRPAGDGMMIRRLWGRKMIGLSVIGHEMRG